MWMGAAFVVLDITNKLFELQRYALRILHYAKNDGFAVESLTTYHHPLRSSHADGDGE